MRQSSKDGIQVFKQHHQPNFSRVTEKEAEEEDDSLDEKWQKLQDERTPDDSGQAISPMLKKSSHNIEESDHLASKQLSYVKGSCKRLKPQESQIKVKQAVKKLPNETRKLGKKIHA